MVIPHGLARHLNVPLARRAAIVLVALAGPLRAADMRTIRIELNDGVINTPRVELPARTRFRVEVTNKGKTPVEFESLPLGLELVVAPGGTRSRALPGKSAGTYPFYDEFHMQTTRGAFVIK